MEKTLSNLTILYITDSVLEPYLAGRCRELLEKSAMGKRIVSVSQKPLDFGDNVCVGDIGRVALSIDIQIKAGLEVVDTPYVAVAEHDCVYAPEHFDFEPPEEDREIFWYNINCWLAQYYNPNWPELDGQFSKFPGRRVQSQMICWADMFRDVTDRKIKILSDPGYQKKFPVQSRVGEPGTNYPSRSRKVFRRDPKLQHLWRQVKDYINICGAKDWQTKIPNIDVRHAANFTGPRRGKQRTYELPYWGTLEDVMLRPFNGQRQDKSASSIQWTKGE